MICHRFHVNTWKCIVQFPFTLEENGPKGYLITGCILLPSLKKQLGQKSLRILSPPLISNRSPRYSRAGLRVGYSNIHKFIRQGRIVDMASTYGNWRWPTCKSAACNGKKILGSLNMNSDISQLPLGLKQTMVLQHLFFQRQQWDLDDSWGGELSLVTNLCHFTLREIEK